MFYLEKKKTRILEKEKGHMIRTKDKKKTESDKIDKEKRFRFRSSFEPNL